MDANSSAPSSGAGSLLKKPSAQSLGFMANAMKRKDSFIQFFAMTGILLLSIRSVGQKYRINDLLEDTDALTQEQKTLTDRMNYIKTSLLAEAALDSTGAFAARLRRLFQENHEVTFFLCAPFAMETWKGSYEICDETMRVAMLRGN